MTRLKTHSIERIENRMAQVEAGSLRHKVLQSAKSFKTSWVELGQSLYSIWKDKAYKEWGYAKFETYTAKEIGIRKQTALKLLKSYYFLEKEEPRFIKEDYVRTAETASVPTYEAIDALRRANSNKDIDKTDYATIRKNVLEGGRGAVEVKRDLTALIRQREELEPEEARGKRRAALVKRLISLLRSVREEIRVTHMLPAQLLNDTEKLIGKLEREV